jgi:hypothetical protein
MRDIGIGVLAIWFGMWLLSKIVRLPGHFIRPTIEKDDWLAREAWRLGYEVGSVGLPREERNYMPQNALTAWDLGYEAGRKSKMGKAMAMNKSEMAAYQQGYNHGYAGQQPDNDPDYESSYNLGYGAGCKAREIGSKSQQ